MYSAPFDRLGFLMLSGSQSGPLIKQMSAENFRFTVINSTGSLVQEGTICLMIGLSHDRIPLFLDIVRSNCRAYRRFIPTQGVQPAEFMSGPMVEAQIGGAAIYVMNVERFEQI